MIPVYAQRPALAARFNFVLRMQAAMFCAAVKAQKDPSEADAKLASDLDGLALTLTGTPLLHKDGTVITDPCDEVAAAEPATKPAKPAEPAKPAKPAKAKKSE